MRLNLVAWFRFVTLVIKEVCVRAGLSSALDKQIEASGKEFDRLEQAWTNACEAINYIEELEQWDLVLA